MKNFSIIDAHIHLWDTHNLKYKWLDQFPIINHNFSVSDYDGAIGSTDIEKFIFVQAECRPSQYMDEVKWVERIAGQDKRLGAIIPWAPIHTGNAVAKTLEDFHKNNKIKGVRQILQSEADINFCLKPDFIQGIKLLGHYNLHFEITISPDQFPSVIKLVEQCPDTRFILDHVGNPNIFQNQMTPWNEYIKRFAESGNHFCKFSNLVCNANLSNWRAEDLKPYSDHVIDSFGSDRIIWSSDWPHVLRASTWLKWFETASELTSGLSENEQRNIFRENAIKFYNL